MKYLAPLLLLLLPSCLATSADLERLSVAFDETIIEAARENEQAAAELSDVRLDIDVLERDLAQALDQTEQDQERIAELEEELEELGDQEAALEVKVAGALDNLAQAKDQFGEDVEAIADDVKARYETVVNSTKGILGGGPIGALDGIAGLLATAFGVNVLRNRSRERGDHLPKPSLTE